MRRLAGQGIAPRIDGVRLLIGGALVAAVGEQTAALASSPAMACAGFTVIGIGSSLIAPTAFTLVGTLVVHGARTRAVARAMLLEYFGYFIGPPPVGFSAGACGRPWAWRRRCCWSCWCWPLCWPRC